MGWGNKSQQVTGDETLFVSIHEEGSNLHRDLCRMNEGRTRGRSWLATPTGFEPAISALTGQYVKPLHHGPREKEL